jgi:hypothetical protein
MVRCVSTAGDLASDKRPSILNGADHRYLPRSTPDLSAKKMEKGGGSSPAA